MLTGNKGEWSEPYALLKAISDGELHLGDENFNQIEDVVYPIIRIIRHEKDRQVSFTPNDKVVVVVDGTVQHEIPLEKFVENTRICFEQIQKGGTKEEKGAFAIPEVESFLNSFSIVSLKAKSNLKNDITVQISDPNTYLSPSLGFSIKSQMGSPSTLVNASKATNFTYRISGTKGLNSRLVSKVNETRLFSEKLAIIEQAGCSLMYERMDNAVFRSNLQTIDFYFDRMVSDILLMHYANNDSKQNTISNYVRRITEKNVKDYDLDINPDMYEMMMKRFLTDYALGMRAAEVWKRDYQATGGYLIVRSDGELICYHFYFAKNFEDYLFNNTKLETPDPKRHGIGQIYFEDGFQKIKLNLQIRFIK